ncbi:MAG: DNA-3-methyladenine glycosylase [Bacteroidetes bacterium]|nr:DNA-3-methyladenine glycosylase [Bacteroidota bacterium]MCL5025251.1 DNA-3-methyladenine glycosylase [Chloroflexota bacterium]
MQRQFYLRSSPPFDFDLTASLFARFPSEIVDVYRDGVYYRVLDLDGKPALTHSRAEPDGLPRLNVCVADGSVADGDLSLVEARLRCIFDLDFPLDDFYAAVKGDPLLAPLAARYNGLRTLVRPYLFEMLVMSITTQQINLTFAYNLKARLVRAFGQALEHDGQEFYAFPSAEALAGAAIGDLRQMQYSERKADYIIGLARKVVSGELDLEGLARLPDEEFIQELTRVRGLGRWSAEWALSRGLGRPDVVAADDIGVQRAFSRYCFGGRPVTAAQVREQAERWRPYRSYAVHYLLMALYHRLDPWHTPEG